MGFDIIRIDLKRFLILGHRFFELSPALVGYPEIKVDLSKVGLNTECFFIL
jgi:hypothetical protein